ncbi:MAG: CHRD domain-containing protein [Rhizobiaceae bacterium]|nr:CHRD domain-containing protein [Rhizobiaceae bacterium]
MARITTAAFVVAAITLAAASVASAETIELSAELSGKNDIPPNDTTGTGQAVASYNTETRVLSWKVTYEGLTGPAMAAHIHGPAPSGGNAGVMIGFTSAASPIEGTATLDDAKAQAVLAGHTYVNVHTQAYPGGEIRGALTRK